MRRGFAIGVLVLAAISLFMAILVFGGALMIEFQATQAFGWPWPWTVFAALTVMASIAAMIWAVALLVHHAWDGKAPRLLWIAALLLIAGIAVGGSPIWLDYPIRYGVSLPLLAAGVVTLAVSRRSISAARGN